MSKPIYTHQSWKDIEDRCLSIYHKMLIDEYKPQSIVGLLRGGVVPARIFSDYFDILLDFFALDVKLYNGINSKNEHAEIRQFFGDVKGKKILVVDDIWDSGQTMRSVLDYLGDEDVTTATLFYKEGAQGRPNYYAESNQENEWIVYPWEKEEFKRLIKGKLRDG